MEERWHGFRYKKFVFEEHNAIIVFPEEKNSKPFLAIKTEYWGAFPEAAEVGLLKKGYHLCFIKNDNRWGTEEDVDRKARFIRWLQEEYALNAKCAVIGMSCGAIFAVKLAVRYPELVSCLYLDAPVVNYLSCPCGFGTRGVLSKDSRLWKELFESLEIDCFLDLLQYREMPIYLIPQLVAFKIPIVMVAGDADLLAPYCENGLLIEKAYEDADLHELEVYIKPNGKHHPHGLEDATPVVAFICRHNQV